LTFDLEKYLVEKLDKIDQRLDETCSTLTEVKTIQKNFINEHEKKAKEEHDKAKHSLNIKMGIFSVIMGIWSVYSFLNK